MPMMRGFAQMKSPEAWTPDETESVDSCLMDFDAEELCSAEPPGPALGEPVELPRMRKRQRAGSVPRKAKAGRRKPEPPDDAVDLTAYRQRARKMLEQLRGDPDKAHALAVLAVKLQALP